MLSGIDSETCMDFLAGERAALPNPLPLYIPLLFFYLFLVPFPILIFPHIILKFSSSLPSFLFYFAIVRTKFFQVSPRQLVYKAKVP